VKLMKMAVLFISSWDIARAMSVIREFHSCNDSGVGKDLHAWHKQNRKVGRYQPRHSSAGVAKSFSMEIKRWGLWSPWNGNHWLALQSETSATYQSSYIKVTPALLGL